MGRLAHSDISRYLTLRRSALIGSRHENIISAARIGRETKPSFSVTSERHRYLGIFRKNLVISNVLPQVALHDDRFNQVVRLINAGLIRDNLHEVHDRFAAIAQDPVSRHADKAAPVLAPDQPLVTALYFLYRGRNFLPVVDPASGRLLGVVSTWDVLETMMNKP